MRAWIVLGVVNGLSYALLAVGLVLVYKANRFVNFAHAQLGVLSALLLGKLVVDWGVSWWLAFPVAVAAGAAVGAMTEFLVIRRLARRSRAALMIASIGVAQILLAVTFWTWLGPDPPTIVRDGFPVPFQVRIDVGALTLRGHHALIIVLVPLLALALGALLRYTLLGKVIRASASNPDAAGLAGISVKRVSSLTWLLAGAFAAVSAILQAPNQPIFSTEALGPSLLLRAVGAAAIAGFVRLPAAFAAGVGLGVLEGIVLYYTQNAGATDIWIRAAILAGLFARARLITADTTLWRQAFETSHRPIEVPHAIARRVVARRHRLIIGSVGIFAGVIAPQLPIWDTEGKQFLLSVTLVLALVAVSLVLLTGWGGQISLGQFAFVGVGAFSAARMLEQGMPLAMVLPAAGVAGAVVAVVVGLPALRIPGLTLAVTTLGLAVASPSWLFRTSYIANQGTTTVSAPELPLIGGLNDQRAVYFFCLAVLALVLASASRVRRSAAGRLVIAVRDNELATASFGVRPATVKVGVFAASGFVASLAGVLWLVAYRSISVESFPPQQSMAVLSLAVIGGIGSLPGAVLGATALFAVPSLTADWFRAVFTNSLQFQIFLGGVGLVVVQLVNPGGIAEVSRRNWERFLAVVDRQHRRRLNLLSADREIPDVDGSADEAVAGTRDGPDRLAATLTRHAHQPRTSQGAPLAVHDVVVRFGTATAVDGASLEVRPGEIVGLIGTNGAGKTTLLNAITGFVPTSRGEIVSFGIDLTALPAWRRSRHGLARSFQDARLFPGLTVRETLLVAAARRGQPRRELEARVDEILHALHLDEWSERLVAELSTGSRRICDLGAQIARKPHLLLLDEPTAGVAQREAERFGPLLRSIAGELHCAVLIVEHDMPLMLNLADRIYCLERGRVIAEGDPQSVRSNPAVIASYLGTDENAIARSGTASTGGLDPLVPTAGGPGASGGTPTPET